MQRIVIVGALLGIGMLRVAAPPPDAGLLGVRTTILVEMLSTRRTGPPHDALR